MKPRTKKEREVFALHDELRPLTGRQETWGWRRLNKRDEGQTTYYRLISFLTTCKGYQVVRTFEFVIEEGKRHIEEVMQHWYDENGVETILGIDYTRNVYSFSWRFGSKMSIKYHNDHCSGYYVWEDIFSTEGNDVCPYGQITATLKRNGWCRRLLRLRNDVGDIIQRLLADRDAEWLVKIKQYELLAYLMSRGDHVVPYKYAVKVALRTGYVLSLDNIGLWYDYLALLNEEGRDLHNAHYVCPADLKKAHDRLVLRKEERMRKEAQERREKKALENEGQYKAFRGMFFGVAFDDGKIYCHVLRSVKEFLEEGTEMHHCVFANEYWSRQTHPDSLILSARDKDGKRLETVEVNTKTWKVIQSYGLQNHITAYHGEIIALVGKYMPMMIKAQQTAFSRKITA